MSRFSMYTRYQISLFFFFLILSKGQRDLNLSKLVTQSPFAEFQKVKKTNFNCLNAHSKEAELTKCQAQKPEVWQNTLNTLCKSYSSYQSPLKIYIFLLTKNPEAQKTFGLEGLRHVACTRYFTVTLHIKNETYENLKKVSSSGEDVRE